MLDASLQPKQSLSKFCLPLLGILLTLHSVAGQDIRWKKHVVMELGHCNTAVALDAAGDSHLDVIASYADRVSLFVGPDWKREVILLRFPSGRNCIHSALLDVDQDGDLDWAGAVAHEHPIWLENPGKKEATQGAWAARDIDLEITGIHCILATDVDNDGKDDLIINNFEPEKGIGDSMAWFRVPPKPKRASTWKRNIFADRDARGGSHYFGAADIDGDGWKEIAVGAKGNPFEDGNWFAFWKNPGQGQLHQPWTKTILAEQQTAATNILPADVNGDGRMDWLASRGHGIGLLWFENPTWDIHEIDTQIQFPHSLTVADHDRDGDVDAASCGYGSETLVWYENDGNGKFEQHLLDANQQSYDLRSMDMDGDGDLDLLNAGRATGNVAWYENPLVR